MDNGRGSEPSGAELLQAEACEPRRPLLSHLYLWTYRETITRIIGSIWPFWTDFDTVRINIQSWWSCSVNKFKTHYCYDAVKALVELALLSHTFNSYNVNLDGHS